MKNFTFLVVLCTMLFSAKLAQAQYAANGVYMGKPVHNFYLDFTKLAADKVPAASLEVQSLENLGIQKYQTASRPLPYFGKEFVTTLFNNNRYSGLGENSAVPANIYVPTLKDGVGTIRLRAFVSSGIDLNMFVNYFDQTEQNWINLGYVAIPGKNTTATDTECNAYFDVEVEDPTQLNLSYKSASYISIAAIEVSAYGEAVGTSVSDERYEQIKVIDHMVLLPNDGVYDVTFFSVSGQELFHQSNVSNSVQLPEELGFVRILSQSGDFCAVKKIAK